MKFLLILVLALFASSCSSDVAEEETLGSTQQQLVIWDAVQVTEPMEGWPASGVVLCSDTFTSLPISNGIVFSILYEEMLPDGNVVQVGYTSQAVVEEELEVGVFAPIAAQFDAINNINTKAHQILIITQASVFDQGVPENLSIGGSGTTTQINRIQGSVPPSYRLCIVRNRTDESKPDLDSLTISAYSRETEAL